MSGVEVSAVLLAAGLSSRMGEDNKMLLDLGGKKVIRRTLENLEASNVSEVKVVLGNLEKEIGRELVRKAEKTTLIFNPKFLKGMTTSIQRGVSALKPKVGGVMICLGDMPLIRPEEYNELMAFYSGIRRVNPKSIAVPFKGKIRGNPVIFSSSHIPEILRNEALNGCRGLIKTQTENVREFQTERESFFADLDTPEDYRRVRESRRFQS